MLFVALFAICLLIPTSHGWQAAALMVAFVVVMVELLRGLREKT
jgi:hypothetical protein